MINETWNQLWEQRDHKSVSWIRDWITRPFERLIINKTLWLKLSRQSEQTGRTLPSCSCVHRYFSYWLVSCIFFSSLSSFCLFRSPFTNIDPEWKKIMSLDSAGGDKTSRPTHCWPTYKMYDCHDDRQFRLNGNDDSPILLVISWCLSCRVCLAGHKFFSS